MTALKSIDIGNDAIEVGWIPITPGSFGGTLKSYTISYIDPSGKKITIPNIPVSVFYIHVFIVLYCIH